MPFLLSLLLGLFFKQKVDYMRMTPKHLLLSGTLQSQAMVLIPQQMKFSMTAARLLR